MNARLTAVYRVAADAATVEARAQAIAVEQSVEMPVAAIDDPFVRAEILGRVDAIEDLGQGWFSIRIGLAAATTGGEAGQLINMLFGNTSLQDDVVLEYLELPPDLVAGFGGPNHGLAGLRARFGGPDRPLTCSALKPQGLTPAALAALALRIARGGLDFIKDDHGLADQAYSRFADRVPACADAVRSAWTETGVPTRYVPSLSGSLDQVRLQAQIARDCGLDTVLVAPMILGLPTLQALVRDFPDLAVMAHPALAGCARIAPPLLLGHLFRLFGADAVVFPNYGGRFGYSPATCRNLAEAARRRWFAVKPAVPVPAGGMTLDRVPEMLQFYGRDVMLLIGGGLLSAGDGLTDATAAFARAVRAAAG